MKYKVKDASHEMFYKERGDISANDARILNWLEYMSDADVVYGGVQLFSVYKPEILDREWEVIKTNIRYQFLKNKETGKQLCVCLSKYKPLNYKNLSFDELLKDKSSEIQGLTKFQILQGRLQFRVYTYLEPTETTLLSLRTDMRETKDISTCLLEHAFIKKDVKIPIAATVKISKGGVLDYSERQGRNFSGLNNKIFIEFDKNKNPHIAVYGCYGNHSQDIRRLSNLPDSYMLGIFLKMAISNINLSDGGANKHSLIGGSYNIIQEIEKDDRLVDINTDNAAKLLPQLKVNYDKVEQIIKRHQII